MPEGYRLPASERGIGWRYDDAKRFKYKVAPDGRVLKTWELIQENSLHTYTRGANSTYSEAARALKERVEMVEAGNGTTRHHDEAASSNESSSSSSSSSSNSDSSDEEKAGSHSLAASGLRETEVAALSRSPLERTKQPQRSP